MPVPDANAVVTTTFSSLPGEAFTTPPAKVMGTANAAIAGNPASSYWVTIWPLAIAERPSHGVACGRGQRPQREISVPVKVGVVPEADHATWPQAGNVM